MQSCSGPDCTVIIYNKGPDQIDCFWWSGFLDSEINISRVSINNKNIDYTLENANDIIINKIGQRVVLGIPTNRTNPLLSGDTLTIEYASIEPILTYVWVGYRYLAENKTMFGYLIDGDGFSTN